MSHDLERIKAAAAKRRRRLERYTNTPQAKAAREQMERDHAKGLPIPPPEPYPHTDEVESPP